MAKCKHCSAPLPKDSIICEYCGVRNDIEVKANKIASLLPKSKRSCPDCLVYLESLDIGKNSRFIIEKCEKCFGLFFDNHELERLLEESHGTSYWVNHKKLHSLLQYPLHKDIVQYRKCPDCSKMMHRKNFMERSGVIMDTCAEHGLWLDAGELKQIQDWIKLGGKEKAEKEVSKQSTVKTDNKRQRLRGTKSSFTSEAQKDSDTITDIINMFFDAIRYI